jgi:hypothetical protein
LVKIEMLHEHSGDSDTDVGNLRASWLSVPWPLPLGGKGQPQEAAAGTYFAAKLASEASKMQKQKLSINSRKPSKEKISSQKNVHLEKSCVE